MLKRENRQHIAKETHLLNENKSLFKQIDSIDKPKKEPSKFEQWYMDTWIYGQVQEIKEDLKDNWYVFKYHVRKFRYIFLDKLDYVADHSFQFAAGFLALVSCMVGAFVYNHMFGYEVTFNGENIGIVKDTKEFENAMKKVDSNLSEWYANPSIFYEKSVSYRKVPIKKSSDILDEKSCEKNIYASKMDLFCSGSVITVNGEETVRVASKEQAKTVINNIGRKYEKEKSNERLIKKAQVDQDLAYVDKIVSLDSVQPVENAIGYLNGESNALQNHGGSDAKTLLNETDDGRELVSALNFRASDFSSGNAEDARPELTIRTVKEVTYTEDIKYKTEYQDDAEIYVGEEKVKRKGKKGIKKVTAINTYKNGKVVKSEVKDKKVVEKPVVKLVARGTKPLPPVTSTGTFLMPASGQISALNKAGSHAGYRAVDIANPMGTPIYASDTGVVTRASWYGGYGNCIEIKHENGYSTLYGHNSAILVSVGQKVEQGEQIARMGSTGNSTGPHCHFEIKINGVRQIILNYFTYLSNGIHVNALQ